MSYSRWCRFRLAVLMLSAVLPLEAQSVGVTATYSWLRETIWIAFAPTGFNPDAGVYPSDDSVRSDLRLLRRMGFTGVITYGADVSSVAKIAGEEGFSAALLGVWDPTSSSEVDRAIGLAREPIVKGIIVGNEGLTFRRYRMEALKDAMDRVRRDTGKPVSTTEIVEFFYQNPVLAEWSDFVTVNAHSYFHGHRDPVRAVDWTLGAWDRISRQFPGKPVLFKEVGLPTAGDIEASESYQSEFYLALLSTTDVQFAFFEAFDQLFKPNLLERSWGLFRADRTPKRAAAVLQDPRTCASPLPRVWCGR